MRIAEGCGRDSEIEFAACLQKARSSTSELEYLLLLSRDLDYLTEATYISLNDEAVSMRKMTSGLLKRI